MTATTLAPPEERTAQVLHDVSTGTDYATTVPIDGDEEKYHHTAPSATRRWPRTTITACGSR